MFKTGKSTGSKGKRINRLSGSSRRERYDEKEREGEMLSSFG